MADPEFDPEPDYGRDVLLATQLLPAWFVPRMMTDSWNFAFMMSNGTLVHFETICAVKRAADGTVWIDVELKKDTGLMDPGAHGKHFTAPVDRFTASINASHVMVAFETADT